MNFKEIKMKISELKDKIEYCYTDIDGLVHEFFTLNEAVKSAKKYSQDNPDYEVNVFILSSIIFVNGDLEF